MYSLVSYMMFFFFFKQKTAYEMRIIDWSSDVCSSDLRIRSRLSPADAGNVPRGWRSASRRRACLPPYDDAHARSFRGGRDVGSGVVRERGDGRNRDASAGGWRTSDARRGGLSVGRFTGRRRTVSAHSEHGCDAIERRLEAVKLTAEVVDRKSTRLNSSH